jgi:hypothetical protein
VLEGYGHICLINHELNLEEEISDWIQGAESSGIKKAAGPPSG